MKATLVLLGLFFFVALSVAQLSVGTAWQGTWSSSKRTGFSAPTYICVDTATNTAHGTYGNAGLFSGSLHGSKFSGFWYEAGYDRPYGSFDLTITTTSFSGTWKYVGSTTTYQWTASRSNATRPDVEQCLTPSNGDPAEGTYAGSNYVCYDGSTTYSNTKQQSVSASFHNFGSVVGYSFDNGYSVLLSDFYIDDDDDQRNDTLRPEQSLTPFGPNVDEDDDGDEGPNTINTRRIAVGRIVSDGRFCGFFWKGLYHRAVGNGAQCFDRVSFNQPDGWNCRQEDIQHSSGLTSWLLDQIQDALDNIRLPPVTIVPNDPFISNDTFEPSTHTTKTDTNTNSRTTVDSVNNPTTDDSTQTSDPNTGSQTDSNDSSFYTSQTSVTSVTSTQSGSQSSATTLAVSFIVVALSAVALI